MKKTLKEKMKELGCHIDDFMATKLELALNYKGKGLSTVMLDGPAGSGKTFLVETLAKVVEAKLEYYQAVPTTSFESLVGDIDVQGVVMRDSSRTLKKGKLVRAIENTTDGLSFLFLDEWDKARPEIDAYLLDFLQSGRLSGTPFGDLHVATTDNIVVFIAKNDEREVSEPLARRCRYLKMNLPSPGLVHQALMANVEGYDSAMMSFLIKLYAVQIANINSLRKCMTIQEIENALLDDIQLKEAEMSFEERIKNALLWAAQYEDDRELTSLWASKIPFGEKQLTIKENGGREQMDLIIHDLSDKDSLKLLIQEVLEEFSYHHNKDDDYDDDNDDYDSEDDNNANDAILTLSEGDLLEIDGECCKVLSEVTLCSNGVSREVNCFRPRLETLEQAKNKLQRSVGFYSRLSYEDIKFWQGKVPEFEGFLDTKVPQIKPLEIDIALAGHPAGQLSFRDADKAKLKPKVTLLADNGFVIGNYTFVKRAEGFQVFWNGESLCEDKDDFGVLSNVSNLIFKIDLSHVDFTVMPLINLARNIAGEEGKLATIGENQYVLVDAAGGVCAKRIVLSTKEVLIYRETYLPVERIYQKFNLSQKWLKSNAYLPVYEGFKPSEDEYYRMTATLRKSDSSIFDLYRIDIQVNNEALTEVTGWRFSKSELDNFEEKLYSAQSSPNSIEGLDRNLEIYDVNSYNLEGCKYYIFKIRERKITEEEE